MLNNEPIVPRHGTREPLARRLLAPALLALAPCLAIAQDSGGSKRAWTVEPSVSLRETFTDNHNLQAVKESDAITEASAGVRVTGTAGHLRGFLDYSLTGSVYARHGDANDLRHFLSAAGTAEALDGWAFVDLRASYTQQAISAFGSQSPDPSLSNSNRSDVGSLSIAPGVRGRLGSFARYEARVSYEITRAKGTDAADVENSSALLHLDSGSAGSVLGWTADLSHNVSDFQAGRRTFSSRARVGVTYLFTRELKVGLTGGTERTDMLTVNGESNATWGLQAEWTPSERTSLSASAEKRFFGTAHSLRFTHRTPNTVWAFADSRDLSTNSSQGKAGFGSAYDLFFRQFASVEPDAVRRDALVRSYLQTNGINPNAVVVGGFLASAATLQRTQSLSFAVVGVRNTVTLQASNSRSKRADQVTTVLDDLSTVREVHQRGIVLDWAHRLTPASSISLAASVQRTDGDTSAQQTTLKSITATWTSTLGPRSTLSAGARHAVFDSTSTPYDENALYAAFRLSF